MKKITEKDRAVMAMKIIENIAANEGLTTKRSQATDAFDEIYRITHTINAPKCRRNHANWVRTIDAAIKSERKQKCSGK